MEEQQILEWLVLDGVQGLGIKRQHQLIEKLGSAAAILSAKADELTGLPQSVVNQLASIQQQGFAHPAFKKARRLLDSVHAQKWHLLSLQSPEYPALLKQIPFAPILLYVNGDLSCLETRQLGVVGARKASQMAVNLSYQWAKELAEQRITITSGLALGVDASSHRGALAGRGKTIAVLAHGLDRIYPKVHEKLAAEILERGALVTEFAPGTDVRRDHFPRRNRIISGLCQAVLVVEATIKSGSLITAQYALEQNRDVFAVPGSVYNLMAAGCHHLIKQGAMLVETPADIVQALPDFGHCSSDTQVDMGGHALTDPGLIALLNEIPYDFIHFDWLYHHSGLKTETLLGYLLTLEAEELIEARAASYRRIK